ncbi:hypothetical protein I6I68_10015 [Corynebacterium glucuronolyticum]|uniref:hypothetical protein n=1 Tax=Corynebacterium glucuronolyticum TaxID=39791 RepID=UPI00191E58E3|nr:hypothetical protein [Corynebacterium glucuronolyticum]QQU87933.1 hypothetical protein I6I68_10015 [Corynebacterium glucuronolyticum]
MANKATDKHKKYIAQLFEKANMAYELADFGLFDWVGTPTSLDQVALWLIAVIAKNQNERKKLLATHHNLFQPGEPILTQRVVDGVH